MIYDKDIREPLFEFLEEHFGKVRILEEKNIASSRADVVMVTESLLWGIEIKSDADSYTRLAGQIRDYDRFYDRNLVVAGSSHGHHISEKIPAYWGIITVEEIQKKDGMDTSTVSRSPELDFYILRLPLPNPKMEWEKRIQILWRMELAKIQEWNEMPAYKGKSKRFVQEKILAKLSDPGFEEKLKQQMGELLFERDYTTVAEQIREFREANGRPIRRKRRRRRK